MNCARSRKKMAEMPEKTKNSKTQKTKTLKALSVAAGGPRESVNPADLNDDIGSAKQEPNLTMPELGPGTNGESSAARPEMDGGVYTVKVGPVLYVCLGTAIGPGT